MTTRNPGGYIGEALANGKSARRRKRAKPIMIERWFWTQKGGDLLACRSSMPTRIDLEELITPPDPEYGLEWEPRLWTMRLSPKRAVGKKRTGNKGASR